jgi:hypothetical protein
MVEGIYALIHCLDMMQGVVKRIWRENYCAQPGELQLTCAHLADTLTASSPGSLKHDRESNFLARCKSLLSIMDACLRKAETRSGHGAVNTQPESVRGHALSPLYQHYTGYTCNLSYTTGENIADHSLLVTGKVFQRFISCGIKPQTKLATAREPIQHNCTVRVQKSLRPTLSYTSGGMSPWQDSKSIFTPVPDHGIVGTSAACARIVDPILSPRAAMAVAPGPKNRISLGVSARALGSSGFSDACPLPCTKLIPVKPLTPMPQKINLQAVHFLRCSQPVPRQALNQLPLCVRASVHG